MLMDLPTQTTVWIGIAILLGIFEIFTAGFFFIFFAFGALVAALVSLYNPSILLDSFVFVVASLLFVFFARPLFKRALNIHDRPPHASNVNALIGTEVLVLEPVDGYQGKVKITHTGEVWSAYLDNAEPEQILEPGQVGLIHKIDGAKLVIRPKA